MNAVSVHGGGAEFVRISFRFGRLDRDPALGIDTLNGRDGVLSSKDMLSAGELSSSASHSSIMLGVLGLEIVGEDLEER